MSSVFLRREFGVQVWATDLWFSASNNLQRVRDAGVDDGVFPIHADARSLPFATEFFDAIVSIDSFVYYGTDDLYLNYLARFLKPGGVLGIAGAGVMQEIEGSVPEHLQAWWEPSLCCLHSAAWWRRHWERTGIVDVELADTLPDGWRFWRDWQTVVAPDNATEIQALRRTGAAISATCASSAADGATRVWTSQSCRFLEATRRSPCSGTREHGPHRANAAGFATGPRRE